MMIIGILQADSVLKQFQQVHGDYPEMFVETLAAADSAIKFQVYDVVHGQYPKTLDECHGYVITGSKHSVYDDEPWIGELIEFVRRVDESKMKLAGICFGHQLVAHALGGKTQAADVGWNVGIDTVTVLKKKNYMVPEVDTLNLIVSHKDQVAIMPEGAALLAASEVCPIAMFQVGSHILAVQGHPEFSKAYTRQLMEMRADILGDVTLRKGLDSLEQELDSAIVAKWIVKFLGS